MLAEFGAPVRVTDTAVISTGAGFLLGFYVATTNTGTLVLRDGGASGTAVSGTITPAAGAFHAFPLSIREGLHITKGGTSIDVTFFIA